MEVIHEGWLVKSPPEKKLQGPWKIGKFFQAKWRRRYFVLHKPQASLPGSFAFDYYNDNTLKRFVGNIDLDLCQEVLSALNSGHYKHLFAVVTKDRGRDRTYYLAADTEEEMNKWVKCLCTVCGLTKDEGPEQVTPPRRVSDAGMAPQPEQPRTGTIERNGATNMPSGMAMSNQTRPVHTSPQRVSTAVTQQPSGPSRQFAQPPRTAAQQARLEEYIHIEDCTTGSSPVTSGRTGNDPALLGRVPPAPPDNSTLPHSGSTGSIPDELAPPPPNKTRTPQHPQSPKFTYDVPPKSYFSPDDQEVNFYKVPRPDQGDQTVGHAALVLQPAPHSLYNVPPARSEGHSPPSHQQPPHDFYQVPPSNKPRTPTNHPVTITSHPQYNKMEHGSTPQGFYDHLPSHTQGPRKVSESDTDHNYDRPPPRRVEPTHEKPPITEDLYDYPPARTPVDKTARHSGSSNGSRASQKNDSAYHSEEHGDGNARHLISSMDNLNMRVQPNNEDWYNVPPKHYPSSDDKLDQVPPPPRPTRRQTTTGHEIARAYMNLPDKEELSPRVHQSPSPPATYVVTDDTYDIPKSREPVISMMPPPPCKGDSGNLHKYVNAGPGIVDANANEVPLGYLSMEGKRRLHGGGDGAYTSMSHNHDMLQQTVKPPVSDCLYDTYPSNVPLSRPAVSPRNLPPRMAKAISQAPVPQTGEETVILPTRRTQSFKRKLSSSSSGSRAVDIKLPTRKTALTEENSSSDEYASDDNSSANTSMEQSHYPPISRAPMEPPPHSISSSLNVKPPPPKSSKEKSEKDLQYSYLDLMGPAEKSPGIGTRAPAPTTIAQDYKVEYKDIDFFRTQALAETKKNLESQRKSSETDGK